MIRLICSDIDGTLVPDGSRNINPEVFEVIGRLHERGIHFAICSGRAQSSILGLFEPVREKIFIISLGGAMIGTCHRTLFQWAMPGDDLDEMIRQGRRIPGCELELDGVAHSYLETKNEEFKSWILNGYGTDIEMVEDLTRVRDQIVMLSMYHSGHQAATVFRDFMETWQDRYKVGTAGAMWLDVQRKDTNKGRAVAYLQESLGITPEETMVFGDQRNDVEMMRQAYHSYAVENAVDEVKEAARFVTGRCDEDGVLKVLKRVLAGDNPL